MRSIFTVIIAFVLLAVSPVFIFAKSDRSEDNPGSDKRVEHSSEHSGKSIKIEAEDDTLILTDDEDGEETETDEFEIEGEDQDDDSDDTTVVAEKNSAVVIRNKLSTQTKFPLRVNIDTNELIVITPKGEKVVTILPDKAILNMLAANVLDELGGKGGLLYRQENPTASASATPSATESAEPSPIASGSAELQNEAGVELVLTDDGELAYKIEGTKSEKLLGLFLVKLQRKVYVSAENGEIINVYQSIFTRILDALSTPA